MRKSIILIVALIASLNISAQTKEKIFANLDANDLAKLIQVRNNCHILRYLKF